MDTAARPSCQQTPLAEQARMTPMKGNNVPHIPSFAMFLTGKKFQLNSTKAKCLSPASHVHHSGVYFQIVYAT